MPKIKLTARNVTTLPVPAKGQVDYWDLEGPVPMFGLRISAEGLRTFTVCYRPKGSTTQRRLTLGEVGILTLGAAREEAAQRLAEVRLGGDPQAERRAMRSAQRAKVHEKSFAAIADQFLAAPRKKPYRPKTRREWTRIIERELKPVLGALRPEEITRRLVKDLLRAVAVTRGKPIQANRILEVVRRIFSWAVAEELVGGSPCVGIEKPGAETRRARVYRAEEIRALCEGVVGTELEVLVPLILFTAARSEEARAARFDQMDLSARLWTIPPERSKNGEVHPIPLSAPAVRLIEERRAVVRGPWLFPASTREGYMDHPQHAVEKVRRLSGVSDFRLHDLRRTVATGLAELGTLDPIVEAVLGHTPPGLKRTYNRYQPIREMRVALEGWAAQLQRADDPERWGEVVAMRR